MNQLNAGSLIKLRPISVSYDCYGGKVLGSKKIERIDSKIWHYGREEIEESFAVIIKLELFDMNLNENLYRCLVGNSILIISDIYMEKI